jgi:hypothetical protein
MMLLNSSKSLFKRIKYIYLIFLICPMPFFLIFNNKMKQRYARTYLFIVLFLYHQFHIEIVSLIHQLLYWYKNFFQMLHLNCFSLIDSPNSKNLNILLIIDSNILLKNIQLRFNRLPYHPKYIFDKEWHLL